MLSPIAPAGLARPNTPTVVLIKKLPVAWPADFISPCKRWLGIDNRVAILEVKLPAPFLTGSGSLLYNFAVGFKIALSTLDGGRIGIASQALGIAQASLDASVNYSKERIQFSKPISSNQAIQFKLADMAMEIEAARLLIHKAAWMKDLNKNFGHLASMAKVYASEVAMRASTNCVQIHGGYGYIKETGVERLMRDAKITQIYEGTSEIQRVVIARSILK